MLVFPQSIAQREETMRMFILALTGAFSMACGGPPIQLRSMDGQESADLLNDQGRIQFSPSCIINDEDAPINREHIHVMIARVDGQLTVMLPTKVKGRQKVMHNQMPSTACKADGSNVRCTFGSLSRLEEFRGPRGDGYYDAVFKASPLNSGRIATEPYSCKKRHGVLFCQNLLCGTVQEHNPD